MRRDSTRTSPTLSAALRTGTYRPQAIRRALDSERPAGAAARWGFRRCGTASCKQRCVWSLEPIFDATFAAHSYGFRPGRGAKDALRRVDALLNAGYRVRRRCGPKGYFDTIPHERLLARVAAKVSDSRVLALVEAFLQQPIFEGLAQWTVDEGTPQGAVISPAARQSLSRPAGPSDGRGGLRDGALCR